jgi:hypothetical protein
MEIYVDCYTLDPEGNLDETMLEFKHSHPDCKVKVRYLPLSGNNPQYRGHVVIVDGLNSSKCDEELSKIISWNIKDPDNGNLTFDEV